MKALILNSGLGTRMGDETKIYPKCMVKLYGNVTILRRQLEQLGKAGINDIVMTTGFCGEELEQYVKKLELNLNIKYVKNDIYEKTNYIYSIYMARQYLHDDVLLIHGDLVFEQEVLQHVLQYSGSCMVVDSSQELPDKDFKAVINKERIEKIGINYFNNAVAAQPMYKLLKKEWEAWLAQIVRFCECGKIQCYAEDAWNDISEQAVLLPCDIKGLLCNEIDTLEDWKNVVGKIVD